MLSALSRNLDRFQKPKNESKVEIFTGPGVWSMGLGLCHSVFETLLTRLWLMMIPTMPNVGYEVTKGVGKVVQELQGMLEL